MKLFHIMSLLLVLIGGINWGLVGLVDLNLVGTMFGDGILTTIVYLLVTISTLYHVFPMIINHFSDTVS